MDHIGMMRRAIRLAEGGVGKADPNPLVGAVIVKEDQIIGQGFHERYGSLHAERNALASCTVSPEGAALYVTLEPCCHYGKTPPCTDAIIESGIKRVFVGILDPNPLISGQGVEILRRNGIEVDVGLLARECEKQNEAFLHFMRTGKPYVVMKYAMTMDGKIATSGGESRWITGDLARERVHHDRNRYQGIMVGIGTVLADDPMLDCRVEGGRNPIRIICDSNLRTPLSSRIVRSAVDIPTILATTCMDELKQKPFREACMDVLVVPERGGRLDLEALMDSLGQRQISSILLEGGSRLNYSAMEAGIVDKVQAYIAPRIFGGETAKSPVGGEGFLRIIESVGLEGRKITLLGDDILIESEVKQRCSQGS